MKVVLFCGGLGLRMGESSDRIPKPMVTVGNRPILLHIMKYYAHYGHTDFVLCLGYKADVIKDYFLNYREAMANDFVLSAGSVELLRSDMDGWRITFADTGLNASVGQRLRAVRHHLAGEEMFLATYGDGVTDASLPDLIDRVKTSGVTAGFLCVRPTFSFHCVDFEEDGVVTAIRDFTRQELWINGGYFVMRQEVFDVLEEGEELVEEPFQRLIDRRQLLALPHNGFWAPMDTLKDRQTLESLVEKGRAPWAVWEAEP